jgi:hypothetical protein
MLHQGASHYATTHCIAFSEMPPCTLHGECSVRCPCMTGEHVEEIGMLQRRATFPARAPPRTGTGNNSCRIPRHSMLFHSPICGRYDTNEVSSSIGIFIGHVVVGTDIDQRELEKRHDHALPVAESTQPDHQSICTHNCAYRQQSRTRLGCAPLDVSVCIPEKSCGACRCGVFDARHGAMDHSGLRT